MKRKADTFGLFLKQTEFKSDRIIVIEFQISAGYLKEKKPEDTFIPSGQAQRLFEKGMIKDGEKIGFCSLFVHPEQERILWDMFFPINRKLSHHGIGSIIQAAIVARMKKRFPTFLIRSTRVTGKRLGQLGNHGINPKKEYPIKEYYQLTKGYLSRKFNEKRKSKMPWWKRAKKALRKIV